MLKEYINFYNRKANQNFYIPEGNTFIIDDEKGFLSYEVDGEILYVGVVAGDGCYWNGQINQLAKENNCKKIMFGTYRKNPAAFTRKYGYKVVGFLLEKEVE